MVLANGDDAMAAHARIVLIAAAIGLAAYGAIIGLIYVFRLIGLTD